MSQQEQPNNPLHGVTLKAMVEAIVETHGWDELGHRFRWRCFNHNPTVKSVLTFLRKTDWARRKVERLYLQDVAKVERNKKRNARRKAQRQYRAEQEAAASSDAPTKTSGTVPSAEPVSPAETPVARTTASEPPPSQSGPPPSETSAPEPTEPTEQ